MFVLSSGCVRRFLADAHLLPLLAKNDCSLEHYFLIRCVKKVQIISHCFHGLTTTPAYTALNKIYAPTPTEFKPLSLISVGLQEID